MHGLNPGVAEADGILDRVEKRETAAAKQGYDTQMAVGFANAVVCGWLMLGGPLPAQMAESLFFKS